MGGKPDGGPPSAVRPYTCRKWLAELLIRSLPENAFEASLVEQEAAQGTQVIQDAAAGGHVSGEFRKIEMDQLKSFLAAGRAVRTCHRDVCLHLGKRLVNGIGEVSATTACDGKISQERAQAGRQLFDGSPAAMSCAI